jgi:hypothetical protein
MPMMTGIELATQLQLERPNTHVLLMSGVAAGMLPLNEGWQFLPRPFMSNMLKVRILDLLRDEPPVRDHPAGGDGK